MRSACQAMRLSGMTAPKSRHRINITVPMRNVMTPNRKENCAIGRLCREEVADIIIPAKLNATANALR